MEEKAKRTRRSHDEIKADLEAKLKYHKDAVAKLEKKLADLDKPKVRKSRLSDKGKAKQLIEEALKDGKTMDEIAKALKIKMPDNW